MADKKEIIKKLAITAFILLMLALLLYAVMRYFGWTDFTREEIQEYIESTGVWAPLIYILISFLQVTFVPIPASITIIAGNYVFGPLRAFVYSYVGMMLASIVAFYLGRRLGRPFVNWLSGDKKKVDEWIAKLKGREKVLLFYMFFLPLFPDDLLCSIAGIIPISFRSFFVMQIITRATSIAATLVFMSGEVKGVAYIVCIVIGVLSLPVFVYCYKNVDKVNLAFKKISGNFHRKK